ncbi:MAG: hypothetical protein HUJ53_00085 [Holdemanella sp.]|nr:hypothetical protein [Holdemanella sp.]
MKFSDIDFSAIQNMMANMSPEEKEKINDYAQSMMDQMKTAPVQEETTFYEYLDINEEEYNHLNGKVLDCLESASDLEQYYEDISDADYSASVLFYAKAFLSMLRTNHYSIYRDVLQLPGFNNPNMTTLQSYLFPLMKEETIQTLINNGIGTLDSWYDHKMALQQVYTLLNKAEFDFISIEELESLKYLLFEENALLNIEKLA